MLSIIAGAVCGCKTFLLLFVVFRWTLAARFWRLDSSGWTLAAGLWRLGSGGWALAAGLGCADWSTPAGLGRLVWAGWATFDLAAP